MSISDMDLTMNDSASQEQLPLDTIMPGPFAAGKEGNRLHQQNQGELDSIMQEESTVVNANKTGGRSRKDEASKKRARSKGKGRSRAGSGCEARRESQNGHKRAKIESNSEIAEEVGHEFGEVETTINIGRPSQQTGKPNLSSEKRTTGDLRAQDAQAPDELSGDAEE